MTVRATHPCRPRPGPILAGAAAGPHLVRAATVKLSLPTMHSM
jgi:hypothetical protein